MNRRTTSHAASREWRIDGNDPAAFRLSAIALRALLPWFCVGLLMTVVPAFAWGEVAIDCPADGPLQQMSLHYDADSLPATDAFGTASLPASIHLDPSGMFAIRASGTMEAVMPELVDFDQCLAGKLKEHGATAADTDALAYAANLCRLRLAPSGAARATATDITITSLDPRQAMVFVQRRFGSPSTVTGKPVQLDEFPPRNCNVLTGH